MKVYVASQEGLQLPIKLNLPKLRLPAILKCEELCGGFVT